MAFLKGQVYNGAEVMSWHCKGCAVIIKKSYPEALCIHCSSHALKLALSNVWSVPVVRNELAIMKDIINFSCHHPKGVRC